MVHTSKLPEFNFKICFKQVSMGMSLDSKSPFLGAFKPHIKTRLLLLDQLVCLFLKPKLNRNNCLLLKWAMLRRHKHRIFNIKEDIYGINIQVHLS